MEKGASNLELGVERWGCTWLLQAGGAERVRERTSGPLQDEGQDGWAERRVVAELLQVAAVLPLGPHSHLDETHHGEEGHRQALGHQCEAEPGAQLQEEEEGRYTQNKTTGGQQLQCN